MLRYHGKYLTIVRTTITFRERYQSAPIAKFLNLPPNIFFKHIYVFVIARMIQIISFVWSVGAIRRLITPKE